MNTMTRSIRALQVLSLGMLMGMAACSDDDSDKIIEPPIEEIPTDLTDPAAVIASHEKALAQRDHAAYAALLDDDFEFVPLERDAEDFPWLQGDSWAKAEELEIIGNMFNPEFDGRENPVDAIDAALTVLSQQTLPNGRIELTTTMQGEVLTDANHGWSFDTRVVFELVSREGFLRIVKITEVDAVLAGRSVEESSWGSIKGLYRPPILTNLTDPAKVIESHELALRHRMIDAYKALLDEEFAFYPLEKDAADFPWLEGDSWPKAEELRIIGNMFDPGFAGEENPIHSIAADFTILSQQDLPNGRIEVRTVMQGVVLTAENNGWSFDTIAIFELIPREGFLRIAKITESYFYRPEGTRVEGTSWGTIKASYR